MNTKENSPAKDGLVIAAGFNTLSHDTLKAPAITYDCELIGPDDKDREEFLELMWASDQARGRGAIGEAKQLQSRAETLVKSQWKEHVHNTVMVAGKTDLINKYLLGSAYTAAWYLILLGTGTISTGDTLASHSGWTEQTPYSGNRPAITWGSTSSGSNTASAVSISINATATVAGAGVCSVNSGTSGTLYSASDFSSSRSVASGDTMSVTPTLAVS